MDKMSNLSENNLKYIYLPNLPRFVMATVDACTNTAFSELSDSLFIWSLKKNKSTKQKLY